MTDENLNKSTISAEDTPESGLGPEPAPFRGWRLLGVIFLVVVVLAIVSAVVDWVVIGPLEGRVFD